MSKDASFENALAFAADLIRIPGLPGEEGEVAGRVKAEMDALGLEDIRVDCKCFPSRMKITADQDDDRDYRRMTYVR